MDNKPLSVALLAGVIIVNECTGHGEKHIELRQYRATPELVGKAANIAVSNTASVTFSASIIPDQFI